MTPGQPGITPLQVELPPEETVRARLYRLLACFLSAPPSGERLGFVAALAPSDGPLGRDDLRDALANLARIAARTDPASARQEYHHLFIGLGRGELVPYGSYYLTGFLQEKPLARLRQDLARLGLECDPGFHEPEDHAASVLEVMAGLIDGNPGPLLPLDRQRAFFDAHIAAWMPVFFADLEKARSYVFYSALGRVGARFLALEVEAGAMT